MMTANNMLKPRRDPAATASGITVYGCEPDEARLFRELADRYDVSITISSAAPSSETVALAAGNRCISVSHKMRLTPPLLQELRRVGVTYISTRSAGYNHIDVDFAKSIGISVGNVNYSPDSVADYTLMLILMTVRQTKTVLKHGETYDFRLPETRGQELQDMTVGIIGTGRIGTAVIRRLRGFGCRIVTYDHHPKTADALSLDALLQQSDIVSLHTPLQTDTFHLLDRQRIEQMKPGAFVINTGRGPLLDTAALITALESGQLGGAALDVLEGEEGVFYADHRQEPPANKLLLRLQQQPNVIITPHIAYYTTHALHDVVENTIINCLAFERNKNRA